MVRVAGDATLPPQAAEAALHFHFAPEFATQILAHVLDSLVRVSRRGH